VSAEPLATFWLRERPATPLDTYWRANVPARHMHAAVRVLDPKGALQEGAAAIFVTPYTPLELRAMREARERGLRVLVEVDDDWLGIDPKYLAIVELPLNVSPEVVKRATSEQRDRQRLHREAAKAADAVIVSTPALADLYRPINPNVFVCLNSIDADDWPAALRQRPVGDRFRVGFAGSTSHADDVPLIRDACEWASHQEDIEVRFIGWHPRDPSPSWETESAREAVDKLYKIDDTRTATPETRAEKQLILDREERKVRERKALWDFALTVIRWTDDFATYRSNLAALDVGLCPVNEASPFTAGRSDLKVLEYAAAGALPIVSDSPVYDAWRGIVPMAKTPTDFVELVRWAATHRDEVRSQARSLWQRVSATRTIDQTIGLWREAVR
jgi:hypothetical protein